MEQGGGDLGEASESKVLTRLSDFPAESRFSKINDRFVHLDSLIREIRYDAFLVRRFWGAKEGVMVLLCFAGFVLGTWDLGVGELSGGGDYNRNGILGGDSSGFLHMEDLALILSLLSVICWATFFGMLWSSYPIMRENMVYLVIGMMFVQFGYIKSHADNPDFPHGAGISGWIWILVVNLVMLFLSVFVVKRAVVETRDVHVQQRHSHPDPRVFERAWEDHSLNAWSFAIGAWCVLLNISFWSSAHSIAPSPENLDFSYFLVALHVVAGVIATILLLAIVWLPEFMLGTAEVRIQSLRAREVAGEKIDKGKSEQGKCPVCNQNTLATMGKNGEVSVPCSTNDCIGKGNPGSSCAICESRIPSRIVCSNCGSNTTVGSHFGRVEAW